jgi:hypothetical protein
MAQNAAATSGGAAHQKFATAEDQCQINKFARLHKNYVETKVYHYFLVHSAFLMPSRRKFGIPI